MPEPIVNFDKLPDLVVPGLEAFWEQIDKHSDHLAIWNISRWQRDMLESYARHVFKLGDECIASKRALKEAFSQDGERFEKLKCELDNVNRQRHVLHWLLLCLSRKDVKQGVDSFYGGGSMRLIRRSGDKGGKTGASSPQKGNGGSDDETAGQPSAQPAPGIVPPRQTNVSSPSPLPRLDINNLEPPIVEFRSSENPSKGDFDAFLWWADKRYNISGCLTLKFKTVFDAINCDLEEKRPKYD